MFNVVYRFAVAASSSPSAVVAGEKQKYITGFALYFWLFF